MDSVWKLTVRLMCYATWIQMLWFDQSVIFFFFMMFNCWIDPASVVRNLCEDIGRIRVLWFGLEGHHPVCLSTLADQWTTRVSLEVHTEYAVRASTVNHLSLLTNVCFVHVMLQNCTYLARPSFSHRAVTVPLSTLLIVNECYIDFHENLRPIFIVLRSFSPARD